MLFNGERVGAGIGPEVDVAVDPLEGTRLTALGIPGVDLGHRGRRAKVDVLSRRGGLHGEDRRRPRSRRRDRPAPSPTENVRAVAEAKGMRVADLTVVVLERERHDDLIAELRASGARVNLIRDGDVAPSIAACQPLTGVDMMMGIGGTPEGVISAAAIKCMGGAIQGRLWPRNDGERQALVDGGFDLDRVLTADDLVAGEDIFVAATGVTGGSLLRGVRTSAHGSRDGVDRDAFPLRHGAADRRLPSRRTSSRPANGGSDDACG